jgi:hypothetical protein
VRKPGGRTGERACATSPVERDVASMPLRAGSARARQRRCGLLAALRAERPATARRSWGTMPCRPPSKAGSAVRSTRGAGGSACGRRSAQRNERCGASHDRAGHAAVHVNPFARSSTAPHPTRPGARPRDSGSRADVDFLVLELCPREQPARRGMRRRGIAGSRKRSAASVRWHAHAGPRSRPASRARSAARHTVPLACGHAHLVRRDLHRCGEIQRGVVRLAGIVAAQWHCASSSLDSPTSRAEHEREPRDGGVAHASSAASRIGSTARRRRVGAPRARATTRNRERGGQRRHDGCRVEQAFGAVARALASASGKRRGSTRTSDRRPIVTARARCAMLPGWLVRTSTVRMRASGSCASRDAAALDTAAT